MKPCPEPVVSSYFRWKHFFDVPLTLLLLIPAIPIIGLAVLLVRLTSKGPGIYTQVRLGLSGKPFVIYKIRSMRIDAEAATGAVWAARKDNRITFIGKILRKTHIDELPQLYNVVRGEMALVGPRPERPEFVNELEKRIDGYIYRLNVKPGLTGLAQLNQASDIDLNDVRRKLAYDFEYIEKSSLWFDFRLIFCTSLKMVHLCNPVSLNILRLYRNVTVSPWAAPLMIGNYADPRDEERLSGIFAKRVAS
ncbi:hypothetical protein FACS1894189_7710 [Planctomycetales bacterium]|nr:hypothetical protein FACS1894189_7710 [Planctomycetales bacterium]